MEKGEIPKLSQSWMDYRLNDHLFNSQHKNLA